MQELAIRQRPMIFLFAVLCTLSSNSIVDALEPSNPRQSTQPRRNFLIGVGGIATSLLTSPSFMANAQEDENIEVYFGCGCFWHVQHEFVEAERKLLGRTDSQLTARAGYAGGTKGSIGGKVCYHNAGRVADYGSLGHAEVVRLNIPASKFTDFAIEYCNLFSKEGYRADQFGDRGSEYRNLVGIPGGTNSEYAKLLVEASVKAGDKLDFAKGKGDDDDRRALSFIMDTKDFPFYMGEQYHQFHDGFNPGENYPNSYNGLAGELAKKGTLGTSDCPNGLIGIGMLGL